MPIEHQKRGATALLFDRLMAREQAGDGLVRTPVRTPAREIYDSAGLRASIAEQLGWLLNTRVPVDYETLEARMRAGTRSTIDYGLPDLTIYPVGDSVAMAKLCEHLARTIERFEPRLLDPRIKVTPSEDRGDMLIAEVTGRIRIGMVVEPVSFALPFSVEEGLRNGD